MHRVFLWVAEGSLRIWRENRAQDLIEYALLASVVAVAAGAVLPPVSGQVSAIFSKIASLASSTPAS